MPTKKQAQSRIRTNRRESQWREKLMAVMQPLNENSNSIEINVGHRLQELRKMQGLSIRSLAEISGLNFNTLSLIENEKTSPNVSTLQQIAAALQVPMTAFFDTSFVNKDVVFQKKGYRPRTTVSHGELEDLGGGLALGEATPLLMTSKPRTNSGPDAIVHTGQEFIYCLEGSLVYYVGPEEYILDSGDSLIFQAHIPHHWENRSNALNRCILVISPSDYSDRSVGQHLRNEDKGER
jgi:transcriptional regulator with XRE-family HTH domain